MKKWIIGLKIVLQLISDPSSPYPEVVEKVCVKELKKKPNDFYINWFLGYVYVKYDLYQKAVGILKPLFLKKKKAGKVGLKLAKAYFNLQNYNNVVKTLSELNEIPEKDVANYYFGYSLVELGKIAQGIHYLEIYLRHHPSDHLVFCKLGWTYFQLAEYSLSLKAYKSAKTIKPLDRRIEESIELCKIKLKNINK